MNILDNPLIQKYFGCDADHSLDFHDCKERQAYRILQAMQEPIKKGENYLLVYLPYADNPLRLHEYIAKSDDPVGDSLASFGLRLPDSFQDKQRKCCGCKCGCGCHL